MIYTESIDESWWAWFAGIFEGEGCSKITKPGRQKYGGRYATLSINMTDRDIIERIYNTLGGNLYFIKSSNSKWKDQWCWNLNKKEDIKIVSRKILPYLFQRRSNKLEYILDNIQPCPAPKVSDGERFWSYVDKTPNHWIWKGFIHKNGFGSWETPDKNKKQVHRYAMKLLGIDVPPRLDNTCGLKSCVNPDHWRQAGKHAELHINK